MRLGGRGKGQKRAFAISFAVVFLVLASAYVGLLYLSGQTTVHHLPSSVQPYYVPWGKYVPADYYQVAFQNYTQSRTVDPSVPQDLVVLQLVDPVINISTGQLKSILSVTMSSPNQTVDVAFLATSAYTQLSDVLLNRGTNSSVGSAPMFLVADDVNRTLDVGWLGLVPQDHAAALALGAGQAQAGLTSVLKSAQGLSPSILTSTQVAQAAFIADSNSNPLAVGFENFPGVVRTGNLTGTFVKLQGGAISVSNVVGFNSSYSAQSQYKYAKQVYNTYNQFTVYNSFINVQATWPTTQLEEALRLVGGA